MLRVYLARCLGRDIDLSLRKKVRRWGAQRSGGTRSSEGAEATRTPREKRWTLWNLSRTMKRGKILRREILATSDFKMVQSMTRARCLGKLRTPNEVKEAPISTSSAFVLHFPPLACSERSAQPNYDEADQHAATPTILPFAHTETAETYWFLASEKLVDGRFNYG